MDKLEYYFDFDPGYGKGIPVALESVTNLSNYKVHVNISGISKGDHKLWLRARDKNGKWSMMNVKNVRITDTAKSPSIVVNSVTDKTLCAKDSFNVSYDAKGIFNSGNKFNLELSDANGKFNATPIVIGSYTGNVSAIIKAKLPSHVYNGTNYRVRVSSTNPIITGITASDTLVIHDAPFAQTITGASNVNISPSSPYTYNVPAVAGSQWVWVMPTATITPTANSASLLFNMAGTGKLIKVVEKSQWGCRGDTSTKAVNVYVLSITNLTVSTLTPCPGLPVTVSAKASGVYNADNTFVAQLSNSSGSFSNPINIGNLTANPVGSLQTITINAAMPNPLANGTGYRIRVIANSPAVSSGDNGQNIQTSKPSFPSALTRRKCVGFSYDLRTIFTDATLTYSYFSSS